MYISKFIPLKKNYFSDFKRKIYNEKIASIVQTVYRRFATVSVSLKYLLDPCAQAITVIFPLIRG
jgi:hypothetical protein